MIFRVQKLESNTCLIRGYYKPDDIEFIFVCTLHRKKEKEKWHAYGALSKNISIKETKEALKFLEDFPNGIYTWVSKKDFERFYKKHYFTCIDFTKKKR